MTARPNQTDQKTTKQTTGSMMEQVIIETLERLEESIESRFKQLDASYSARLNDLEHTIGKIGERSHSNATQSVRSIDETKRAQRELSQAI